MGCWAACAMEELRGFGREKIEPSAGTRVIFIRAAGGGEEGGGASKGKLGWGRSSPGQRCGTGCLFGGASGRGEGGGGAAVPTSRLPALVRRG